MADAQRLLMGKVTPRHIVRAALGEFCRDAGIEDGSCGYVEREIVIKEGEVVEEILCESRAHDCDVIVMGAHQGFLSGTTIGAHIKAVLKKSKVPVLVVPPNSPE
jgi:nucleotide-binding universal stress UspA family protein